jgi:hypothetical protein
VRFISGGERGNFGDPGVDEKDVEAAILFLYVKTSALAALGSPASEAMAST